MTRSRWFDLALSTAVGLVVLGPFLAHRGFALRGDMVFVPHQPWKDAWLGLDGSTARFVPGDAVVSVLTSGLPGDLVQKALLLGVFVLAGTGAGMLVRHHGPVGRAAAIVLVCWNPWVAERLLIGQWGSVVGYAALPWVVLAAAQVRDDVRRGLPGLVVTLGFTALWSPPAALLGALTALCMVLVPPSRSAVLAVLGTSLAVNLPWVVPSVLASGRVSATGASFEAFIARGESGAGLLASVVSLGGIWKTSIIPDERTMVPVVLLSAVVTAAALLGWRLERRRDPATRVRVGGGLALLASVCVLLTVVPAIPVVTEGLDEATRSIPALALLRDSHRFLGPAVLVLLPGIASAAAWLWVRRPGAEAVRALALLLVVWPVLCLPSMAWGMNGALTPVVYPSEWFAVADVLDHSEGRGTTVVLPWRGGYRGYDWNQSRAMLDPAPRFFSGDVLIDDRIDVDDLALANEDPRLQDVTTALASTDPARALGELGVTHVLVEKANGVPDDAVPAGRVVHAGRRLLLIELGSPGDPPVYESPPRAVVLGADAAAVLVLVAAVACLIRRRVYGAPADDSGRGSA